MPLIELLVLTQIDMVTRTLFYPYFTSSGESCSPFPLSLNIHFPCESVVGAAFLDLGLFSLFIENY